MREGHASLTALAVAMGRGLGTRSDVRDEAGSKLIPGAMGGLLRAASRREPMRWLGRVASLGLVDHVTMRMAAIDAAVSHAVARGCDQLVVLGAGLDARAQRLACLGAVDVLEVDHPDTQATKQRRVVLSQCRARSLRFVPVDFEADSLDLRLDEAGHDPLRPTFWIWEGVTPYLQLEAIDATLRTVGARSAPASGLAMTYAVEARVPLPVAARLAFSALGEPLLATLSPDEAARRSAAVGFAPLSDTDSTDWSTQYPGSARLAVLFAAERLLVAVRHATAASSV